MSKIKDDNHYTVSGWMLNVLNLKSNELVIFAIIYNFSQDGESEFNGSLSYLQAFANVSSKNTVLAILKSLLDKNFIIKREYTNSNNIQRVAYRANLDYIKQIREIFATKQNNTNSNID